MKSSLDIHTTAVRAAYRFLPALVTALWLSAPGFAQDTDPDTYDPRFEIALSGGISQLSSSPDWCSDRYYSGSLIFSMNITDWLAVQGGKEIAYGSDIDRTWFDYGPHYQLNANTRPFRGGTLAGVRFDIPLTWFGRDYFHIHSLLWSAGLVWDGFELRGDEQLYYRTPYGWESGETPETREGSYQNKIADVNGYYIGLAARWRFDRLFGSGSESMIGQYGMDAGVRYTGYSDSSLEYDTLMAAPSGFSGIQLFVTFFTKIDLLF